MRKILLVAMMAALLGSAAGDSKTEAELRTRLEAADARTKAAETRAAAALKDKSALNAELSRLSAVGSKAATATNTASNVATTDAALAQMDAANQAALTAKATADAKAASDQAERVANANNKALIINGFYGLMALVLTGIGTFMAAEIRRAQDRRQADKVAAETKGQLEQIHTLVNSNLTAAMNETLIARKANLALLLLAQAQAKAEGRSQDAESELAIQAVQSAIKELSSNIADRLVQTENAEKERERIEKKAE